MPRPPFRRWLNAWAFAVAAAALVAALATGVFAVSQEQLLGFGTPIPFTEKPLALMERQFAGGLLWGSAAGLVFALPGVTAALGLTAKSWNYWASAPAWIWAILGAGIGLLLALPFFGAASGFFAEAVAALAGAAALIIARRRLRLPGGFHPFE